MTPSSHEVTQLLHSWRSGDESALSRLVPLVYEELHRLAHRYAAKELHKDNLETTVLVNELYIRLAGTQCVDWKDRVHFIAICAKILRRILVDAARARNMQKRDGQYSRVTLDEAFLPAASQTADLVQLDDALHALAEFDPRKAQVVELRFFGGLELEEAAEVLNVSRDTVKRDWKLAKAWLLSELTGDTPRGR